MARTGTSLTASRTALRLDRSTGSPVKGPETRIASASDEKTALFAILVSGPLTGDPVDQSDLKAVREVVRDVPVLANTGVTIDNVRDILAIADGVVIGTHFKVDGNTWNAVDGARVKRFMDAVAKLR